MKKDIGEVYKNKFQNLEQELPPELVWEGIKRETNAMRFYRFSVRNFNIYYLSLIIIVSILSLAILNAEISSSTDNNKATNKEDITQTDSSKTIDQSTEKRSDKSLARTKKGNSKNKIEDANYSLIEDTRKEELKTADTLSEINLLNPQKKINSDTIVIPNTKKAAKNRRVVVVELRDTIVIVDTLHDKKSRKNRNK